MFPAPIRRSRRAVRILYGVALPVSLALWLLPLAGVALTAMRTADDIARGNFWGPPTEVLLVENYASVLAGSGMARFVLNSFLVTLPTVAGAVTLSAMAGYALAKYRFRWATPLLVMFVAGNLVPFQILMIPVRDLMIGLGLYDTRWALVLFHTAFQTGFCTLFMRNFIRQLPDAMIESARLEGWGEAAILWHVVLPVVRPAAAAAAALVFTFVWNDYFWSLVLVQSDAVKPVTAALQSLRGTWLASWHLIAAGSILAALPPVAVFMLMQRHFIAGLTLGATDE